MNRIDLLRLRKRAGISQRELAEILQVRPSFISAIENGKSGIPEEKLEKLKEIFELDNLDDYLIKEDNESVVPPHTHSPEESDTITALLNHFHDLAHQRNRANVSADEEALARIDYLVRRNENLYERLDELHQRMERMMEENIKLKEILLKHGISYD
ncbi:MAG: helix-turn-helix transcriptional regulator [Muribaculaceae bacterium]|nr:helix-turn-helix transcriptional regulator [Muribaculaceae bacterium]